MANMLIALALVISCSTLVKPNLIVTPKTTEVLVGDSTFLNCSTSILSAEIHWFHYAAGLNADRSFVYGYDQFYPPYQGRLRMENDESSGKYNLIIPSATMEDAGRYECQDDDGRGSKDSADLVVLDANPVCQSNIKANGMVGPNSCGLEPEELLLSCLVLYHGSQPPIMIWKTAGTESPITKWTFQNVSDDRVIYYLKMGVNSRMDGLSYRCQTTRSASAQYYCTSETVKVIGTESSSVAIYGVLAVILIIAIVVSCTVGWYLHVLRVKRTGTKKGTIDEQSPQLKGPEEIELIDKQDNEIIEKLTTDKETTEKLTADKETIENLTTDKETIERLTAENIRLSAKVNELEQHMYCIDNKAKRTAARLAHTICTKAAEKTNGPTPITGMTILEHNLFLVKKNCPVVDVYDSETFLLVRQLDKLNLRNPLDIASSRENKFLYVINRGNGESESNIWRFNFSGEGGKEWATENDYGRLSTYECNLIVCFSTKRIIIEYTREGKTVNVVRLSPGNGFNKLWHAVKLTGTHLLVSHSKIKDGQRVCVVDINNNSVVSAFEELPIFSQGINIFRYHLPICLVGQRDESVLVADTRNTRVLLLSPKELEYEDVLIVTDRNRSPLKTDEQMPVRLCLNETKDRLFVAVNSGEYSKPDAWKEGCILIYNLSK